MANQIDFIDHLLIASPNGQSPNTSKMIVGCNGRIFFGAYGSWAASGTGAYSTTASEISTVGAKQDWYLVDGTNTLVIDGTSGTFTTLSASNGTAPSDARLVTLYRNRLTMSRTVSDPHNVFMSRVDDYLDWDYSQEDPSAAIAFNQADAGRIGDSVTCLIPYSDDYLVIGCSDSVWLLRGDPAAGGRIDSLVRGGGIVGPRAFAFDVEGNCFYCTRADVMRIPAGGGQPESITKGRLQRFFSAIDFTAKSVRMMWEVVNKRLWVFFTPGTSATTTHLCWDQRSDSWWPQQFPNHFGPTAVRSLAGEVQADRQLLLGGRDGLIRTFSNAYTVDDRTEISSSIRFAPIKLNDQGELAVTSEFGIVLGDIAASHANVNLYVGTAPQAGAKSTNQQITIDTYKTGYQVNRSRMRGNVAVLELSNASIGTRWAYESGYLVSHDAGRVR